MFIMVFCFCSQVFRRHQHEGQNITYNKEMSEINQRVEKLHQQFQIRASGENGVAKGLIDMSNPMESWLVCICTFNVIPCT